MNSLNTILRAALLGCCIATLASSASAQTTQATAPDAGLIGKRYASADLFIDHVKTFPVHLKNGQGITVAYNQPISENFDLGAFYSYETLDDAPTLKITEHTYGITGTLFERMGAFKPNVTVGVAYDYVTLKSRRFSFFEKDNTPYAFLAPGVEYSITSTLSVDANAAYVRTFDTEPVSHNWNYTAGVNYWVTPKVCVAGHITWINRAEEVIYQLGARVAF